MNVKSVFLTFITETNRGANLTKKILKHRTTLTILICSCMDWLSMNILLPIKR